MFVWLRRSLAAFNDRMQLVQFRLRYAAVLLLLQLCGTLMEVLSVMVLMPVFQFIKAEGNINALTASHGYWRAIVSGYGSLDIPVTLATLLCTSFAFLLLRQGFVYVRLRWNAWSKETVVAATRAKAFESYLLADSDYHDGERTGPVVNDLTVDLQRGVDHLFGHISVIGYGLVLIVYLVSLLVLSAGMTVIALAVFGVALLAFSRQLARSERAGEEAVRANQGMSGFLVERLNAVRLVRLAGMQQVEIDQMRALTGRQRDMMVRLYALLARIEIIMEPIVIGAGFIFIYVSVTSLGLSLERVGLFLLIVLRMLPVIKEIARTYQSNLASKFAFETIRKRLENSAANRERRGGTKQFRGISRAIAFESVSFAYRGKSQRPALHEVSFEVAACQLTALVGPSGAGKSTLIDLLPRLRSVDSGRVRIDDTPLDEFDLDSLRAGIAYAPQSPEIFDASVSEHIRYGKPNASTKEVVDAARLAGAHEFIEQLPGGYAARVGESGDLLSGGQLQRLDLARALVSKAPILLLDEPTSNLDADSEHQFRQVLARIKSETKITVVIIGHRLSTVLMADRIVVLAGGQVAEIGTHAELQKRGGWYAKAFAKQHLGSVRHVPKTSVVTKSS